MFCPNCGAMLNDNASFCTSCGAPIPQQQAPQQQSPQQPVYQQPAQQSYQQPVPPAYQQPVQQSYQQPYQQPYQQSYQQPVNSGTPDMPMKWHKFLCYFGLWLGALLNGFSGVALLTAGAGALSKVYGILLLIIAVFDAYVAICMIKMKKGAPKMLILLYGITLVVNLLFMLISGGDSLSSGIGSLAGSALMIAINLTYYKKREHLFVN